MLEPSKISFPFATVFLLQVLMASSSKAGAAVAPGKAAAPSSVASPVKATTNASASPSPPAANRDGNPPAASIGQQRLHPLCYKMPSPRKIGDPIRDMDRQAIFAMAQQIVNALISDKKAAPSLFNTLAMRRQAADALLGGHDDQFLGLSEHATIKALCKSDAGLMINWVTTRSDMQPD